MIIDSHQHFWTLSRGDYLWPNKSVEPIFHDFAPDDVIPLLKTSNVDKTVLVQATDTVAETEFLLDLAAKHSFIAGVVGWVDLSAFDAIQTIDQLRENPILKGLRPMLQDIEDTEWILQDDVQSALAHMESVGLCFDALIQPRHLSALAQIAQRYPDLPIVIDHIAKPKMGAGIMPDQDWLNGMEAIAIQPNTYCKLSGMVTEIGCSWSIDDLGPFAQHVLKIFTPKRVMFGSDWPVVGLASDYQTWVETTKLLTTDLSSDDQAYVFSRTACQFYGLSSIL